jgi:hypothetical protein
MSMESKNRKVVSAPLKPAQHVIEIWQWGGPCQLETFDPKPDAPFDYNNGLKSIRTNAGFEGHEWLPELAKCADLYSVVRTLTHPFPGHEKATYIMQTGRTAGGGVTYPAIGAIVASMKRKNYEGDLPPFVILTEAKGRFSEVGFLGEAYAPLVTGGDPNASKFIVDGIVPPGGLTKAQIEERFARSGRINRVALDPEFEAAGLAARRIIEGPAAETFDLSREDKKVRERYGRTRIGQQLLSARRLVEYGVPYVSVNYNGWDSHKKHFETMRRPTAQMDQAVSALLIDLKEKGLLDKTIVWMCGEFGRVPKIDRQAPWIGGRNHFPRCFSALVAGGGFKGGQVVGVSDETTDHVKERPVTPVDFLGSICELAGIDPDDRLPNPKGFKLNVMPPASEHGRLKEIYA